MLSFHCSHTCGGEWNVPSGCYKSFFVDDITVILTSFEFSLLGMSLAVADTDGWQGVHSFEMRMCETVKCRPTLAYRVHFDSNNISD